MKIFLIVANYYRDGAFKRTHICRLELTGRFAVNIIDNLIIVHHQASKVCKFVIKRLILSIGTLKVVYYNYHAKVC